MAKPLPRARRWTDAAARAIEALEELIAIQEEYQQWQDNLPDSLQSGAVAEKLEAITDLALEDALVTVQEAEGADLPLGFGRD